MKRGPQSRSQTVYHGYSIKAERRFGWLIGFEITRLCDGYLFASGHTDELISVRAFVKHLKVWLDSELATVPERMRAVA